MAQIAQVTETISFRTLYGSPSEVNKKEMRLLPVHVEAARTVLKLSQTELAEAAGVSRSTIVFFEGGQRPLREETLVQIQATLERRGIEFLNGGSPGVRYHPERDERNRQ